MAATTVTGKGLGAADGQNKGSEHQTLGVGHLIGPRIMVAGDTTVDGSGDGSVVLPALDGTVGDYVVMATDQDATAAAAIAVQMAMDATSTTLTVKGPSAAGHPVGYAIVKKGMAL